LDFVLEALLECEVALDFAWGAAAASAADTGTDRPETSAAAVRNLHKS